MSMPILERTSDQPVATIDGLSHVFVAVRGGIRAVRVKDEITDLGFENFID